MIEYITLSDLVKKVSQDAVEKGKEIFNTSLNENTPFLILKLGESNQCKICVLIAVVGNITTAFYFA